MPTLVGIRSPPKRWLLPVCTSSVSASRPTCVLVTDYIAMVADVALAASAFVGTYYASVSRGLFRGDIVMERVWRLATVAFLAVAFFSVLDFIFTAENSSIVSLHLVRFASIFAVVIFVVAMMQLVRWGKSATEGGNRQSRQYRPR